MPRPTRESLAVDRLCDVYERDWLVTEYRPTAHGFSLPLGWPVDMTGPGNPRVIMIAALAEYLRSVERLRDVALPIAPGTIKRLRAELDLKFNWGQWWAARSGDLHTMTLAAFCAKHHCSIGAASQRRGNADYKTADTPMSGNGSA